MASFRVYIDESGDEGFCFDKGSPEWFVLAAVVTRSANDLQTVKLVDDVKTALGKRLDRPLHFHDLKHLQRLVYAERISRSRLKAVVVMIHKPSLNDPETFQRKGLLYNYAGRYLLERVSWLCRDEKIKSDADGSAHVTFSNRGGLSYDDFRSYLNKLKCDERTAIEWGVIKTTQIEAIQHDKRMGLQIVDAVASSFFSGAHKTKYGFAEGRYATLLSRIMYGYKGRKYGYGVKVFPKDADVLPGNAHMAWLHEVYKK